LIVNDIALYVLIARVDRLKEAKSEAEQIIAAYRAELEQNYQTLLAKQSGSSGLAGNELNNATTNDIAKLTRDFASRKESVEKMLIDAVVNVKVEAPKARGA
jgi:vacuolar-type H+-ATPase subunit H